MAKKTKVLITDDHKVVREGLSAILETKDDIEIVGRPVTVARRWKRLVHYCQMSY